MILRLTHSVTWVRHTTSLVLPWIPSPTLKARKGWSGSPDPPSATEKVHLAISNNLLILGAYPPAFAPAKPARLTNSKHLVQERVAYTPFQGRPENEEKVNSHKRMRVGVVCTIVKSVFKNQPQIFKELCFFQDGVGEEVSLKEG